MATGRADAVAIDNNGLLAALFAADAAGPERILFGPTLGTPVIAVNDPLLGSTVTDLNFVNVGFNDVGQLAFFATLADGRSGVSIATVVPEPGTGVGIACAIAAVSLLKRTGG